MWPLFCETRAVWGQTCPKLALLPALHSCSKGLMPADLNDQSPPSSSARSHHMPTPSPSLPHPSCLQAPGPATPSSLHPGHGPGSGPCWLVPGFCKSLDTVIFPSPLQGRQGQLPASLAGMLGCGLGPLLAPFLTMEACPSLLLPTPSSCWFSCVVLQ